jgi:hypothetical protein
LRSETEGNGTFHDCNVCYCNVVGLEFQKLIMELRKKDALLAKELKAVQAQLDKKKES